MQKLGCLLFTDKQDQIKKAKDAGHNIIQVKIVGDPVEGAERIAEVRSLLEEDDILLIDANTCE